jgi:hypothetical protein
MNINHNLEKSEIIRKFPVKKDIKIYKKRYDNDAFEKYEQIKQSIDNYDKWKSGINFITNRKIKIDGKTHEQIGYDIFYIKIYDDQHTYSRVLFTKFGNINKNEYLQKTIDIKKEIDYNEIIDNICCKVKLLNDWYSYVVFEEKKYGICHVYDGIHRENNCFGTMKKDKYKRCECSSCENWNGCGRDGIQYYKCEKCDYICNY